MNTTRIAKVDGKLDLEGTVGTGIGGFMQLL